jgi:hypothetical protein
MTCDWGIAEKYRLLATRNDFVCNQGHNLREESHRALGAHSPRAASAVHLSSERTFKKGVDPPFSQARRERELRQQAGRPRRPRRASPFPA